MCSARAFADSTYTVTITVQGLPASLVTNVYINGVYNGTLAGGASETYSLYSAASPYLISIDSYVQGSDNGTRYYCQSTSWSVNSEGNQTFTYVTQYFLTVRTAYSTATGQGWYTSGTTTHAMINDQEVPEGQATRNIFSGWTGDATGSQLTSNGIIMDGPKVAIANWITQFLLTVESNPDNATGLSGSGWYKAGTQANFSAPSEIPVAANTRLKFDHWSGEFTGQQPTGMISMDRPKTVKANYLAQYLLTVQYAPVSVAGSYNETHAGWYDTNSDVQLGPAPTIINISPVERLQFSGWADNGSVSNNLSYNVVMDGPRKVTLSYSTQYYLDVRSTYGTVSGSGWYNRGATATITGPTSSGTWPISYTLSGWTMDPPSAAVADDGGSWTVIVNGPYVVQAQWSINYFPLILLFAIAGTVTTVGIGAVVGYKRGALGRRRPQKTSPTISRSARVCSNCGNPMLPGEGICEKCKTPVSTIGSLSETERVYEYIVTHQGVISLSVASTDLGIPVDRLKEITERLKKEGRLG
jgi:Divergent InlB B-repeat domain